MEIAGLREVAKALDGVPESPKNMECDFHTAKAISDVLAVCRAAQQKIKKELQPSMSPDQHASSHPDRSDNQSQVHAICAPECDTYIQNQMQTALEAGLKDPDALKKRILDHCLETTVRNTIGPIWDSGSHTYPFAQSEKFLAVDITSLKQTCSREIVPYLAGVFTEGVSCIPHAESERSIPGPSDNQAEVTQLQLSLGEPFTTEIQSALDRESDPSHDLKKRIMSHYLVTGLHNKVPVDHEVWQVRDCTSEFCNEGLPHPG